MPLFGGPDVGKLESRRDIRGLIKALGHEKPMLRDEAAAALRRLCTQADAAVRAETARQLMEEAQALRNWRISSGARQVLWSVRDALRDPTLRSQLHDWLLADALRMLDGYTAAGVRQAIEWLASLGDPRAVKPLASAADRRWTEMDAGRSARASLSALPGPLAERRDIAAIRSAAIRALGRLGQPAVETLVGFLRKGDYEVRQAAAQALQDGAGPLSVELFVSLLRDDDLTLRGHAADLLGKIGDPRAVQALVSALDDSASTVRDRAQAALVRIGAPALPHLIAGLTHPSIQARRAIAEILDRLHWEPDAGPDGAAYWAAKGAWDRAALLGPIAVGPLLAILASGSPADRSNIAGALGLIGTPALEPLLEALGAGQWQVRAGAAEALGQLADGRAVSPLISALDDPAWEARRAAAEALVCLYRTGTLDETQKTRLLQRRERMVGAHEDHPARHVDRTLPKHQDYEPSSDCTQHVDARAGHTDSRYAHVDEGGIGVEWRL